MRIGVVTTCDITRPNGYRTRVLAELEQLARLGIDASVISFLHAKHFTAPKGISDYARSIRKLGHALEVIPVAPDNQMQWLYKILDRSQSSSIRRRVQQDGITLLHCHATRAAYLGVLAGRVAGLPVVYDMHGASIAEQGVMFARETALMRRLEYTERVAVLGSSAIISVSRSLQADWISEYPDAAAAPCIIPCAVDTARFHFMQHERASFRVSWGVGQLDPVFVYLGSAASYQRVDRALGLFSAVSSQTPGARMLLLVPDVDIPKLRPFASEAGLDENKLLWVSTKHADVPKYLSACDFGFLLRDNLKLNRVSSPTKFGEYVACGVPVIASPYIDDVKCAIGQYQVGFIYEDNADALQYFVRAVMAARNEWSDRCTEFARKEYSWDAYGAGLLSLYRDVLHRES